ncbi:MAG TPA: hypothetical protein VFV38_08540 [Ktedonobacteraceae bacterium]|nr:hypothetical protein [Ktedonobacteraceae bacterium]
MPTSQMKRATWAVCHIGRQSHVSCAGSLTMCADGQLRRTLLASKEVLVYRAAGPQGMPSQPPMAKNTGRAPASFPIVNMRDDKKRKPGVIIIAAFLRREDRARIAEMTAHPPQKQAERLSKCPTERSADPERGSKDDGKEHQKTPIGSKNDSHEDLGTIFLLRTHRCLLFL